MGRWCERVVRVKCVLKGSFLKLFLIEFRMSFPQVGQVAVVKKLLIGQGSIGIKNHKANKYTPDGQAQDGNEAQDGVGPDQVSASDHWCVRNAKGRARIAPSDSRVCFSPGALQ